MRKNRLVWVVVGLAVLCAVGIVLFARIAGAPEPTETKPPAEQQEAKDEPAKPPVKFGVFAANLDTPWSMVFAPDGDMLVTERKGAVKRIGQNGQVYTVKGVHEFGEGGLLGMALHPDFKANHELYLYLTTSAGGSLHNRVDLYTLGNDKLSFRRTILDNIPAAQYHDGGGIKFGPDGKLYVTTGDAWRSELAQNKQSLAGKILRLNPDGSVPSDNPFGNLVWSYGHRNPQSLAWDKQGRLWATEHGPSGSQGSGQDELNQIVKGADYGWPVIRGNQTAKGMKSPVLQSGSGTTWAPSGLAYANGSLFFAGLHGQTLYQAVINKDGSVTLKKHFSGKYGRLRAVTVHGGVLYFSTSNRDGRGSPSPNDDKIYQAPLGMFK